MADAVFIPPQHDDMTELLTDMEVFWHNENIYVPHLIRVALSHYQFETIHPFLDGNGRIGRLLITLYLVSHGLLNKPSLYLSAHLEKHRSAYYDALSRVRESNDIGHWVRFFLQAVFATAENGKNTFKQIIALQQELELKVVSLGRRAEKARHLVMHLYKNPVVSVGEVAGLLNINFLPATRLVDALVDMGVLTEITGYKRNRVYLFKSYLDIFRANDVI